MILCSLIRHYAVRAGLLLSHFKSGMPEEFGFFSLSYAIQHGEMSLAKGRGIF